jgi:serine/threonine protein kinase
MRERRCVADLAIGDVRHPAGQIATLWPHGPNSYRARHRTTGAISFVTEFPPDRRDLFDRAAAAFAHVHRHPAVLGLIGVVYDGILRVVNECPRGGSLEEVLRGAPLSATVRAKLVVGVAMAMAYVHATGAAHRDLRPGTVFVSGKREVRLGGFWSASRREGRFASDWASYYAAPEARSGSCGQPADVFSFGVMCWEVVTGKTVGEGLSGGREQSQKMIDERVWAGERPSCDGIAEWVRRVISVCWDADPSKRKSFREVMQMFREKKYVVVPGADGGDVAAYVNKIAMWESDNPPEPFPEE